MWLTLMRTTHNLWWYDLTQWKKSCHCESGSRVWHCNQWSCSDLYTNKKKYIIVSMTWNHTFAELILKQSVLLQLLYNLRLLIVPASVCCLLMLFFLFLCLWGSSKHFTVPWKVFYNGLLLIKEIRVTERNRKSAWRIQNFHLLSISYSNVAIML